MPAEIETSRPVAAHEVVSGRTKRTCTAASSAACAVLAGTTGFVDFPEFLKPCVNELHVAAVGKTHFQSNFRDKGKILLDLVEGGQRKSGQHSSLRG